MAKRSVPVIVQRYIISAELVVVYFLGLIEYLQEEDNTVPRAGAIAIGGMAGFILGLRGGFFRRLLFTSTGALGMAAICYPNEAAEYSEIAGKEAKRYINIAYNFYRGGMYF